MTRSNNQRAPSSSKRSGTKRHAHDEKGSARKEDCGPASVKEIAGAKRRILSVVQKASRALGELNERSLAAANDGEGVQLAADEKKAWKLVAAAQDKQQRPETEGADAWKREAAKLRKKFVRGS